MRLVGMPADNLKHAKWAEDFIELAREILLPMLGPDDGRKIFLPRLARVATRHIVVLNGHMRGTSAEGMKRYPVMSDAIRQAEMIRDIEEDEPLIQHGMLDEGYDVSYRRKPLIDAHVSLGVFMAKVGQEVDNALLDGDRAHADKVHEILVENEVMQPGRSAWTEATVHYVAAAELQLSGAPDHSILWWGAGECARSVAWLPWHRAVAMTPRRRHWPLCLPLPRPGHLTSPRPPPQLATWPRSAKAPPSPSRTCATPCKWPSRLIAR